MVEQCLGRRPGWSQYYRSAARVSSMLHSSMRNWAGVGCWHYEECGTTMYSSHLLCHKDAQATCFKAGPHLRRTSSGFDTIYHSKATHQPQRIYIRGVQDIGRQVRKGAIRGHQDGVGGVPIVERWREACTIIIDHFSDVRPVTITTVPAAEVRPEAHMAGSISPVNIPVHGESSASSSAGKDGCKTAASKQQDSSDISDCLTKGGKDNTSTCAVGQREEGCRVRPAPEQLQHSWRAVGLHIETQAALDMMWTHANHASDGGLCKSMWDKRCQRARTAQELCKEAVKHVSDQGRRLQHSSTAARRRIAEGAGVDAGHRRQGRVWLRIGRLWLSVHRVYVSA